MRLISAFCLPLLFFILPSCKNNQVKGRYISEKDTSFSQDIRDVSAKINQDPDNPELYYKRGNAFYYQNRFTDAGIDFSTAVSFDSMNAMYHFRLGECVLKQDTADPVKALRHLKQAVRLKPDFHEASFTLAKLHVARQEYDNAAKILEQLKSQADYTDKSWLYEGIISREKRDTTRAMMAFERALQANPQNYDAVMQIAAVHLNRGNDLCLKYYDRALAINEFSDEALYGKGIYLQRKGRYADAVALYDQVRTMNPAHVLALYNTAFIQSLFEEWDKCISLCTTLIEMAPQHANALALRGYAHEKKGQKKAALDDYNAALDIDPQNKPARAGLELLTK